MTPTNQTPNTDTVTVAAITVTTEAADAWAAQCSYEEFRDRNRAAFNTAEDRRCKMIDAICARFDAGEITRIEMRALCDQENERYQREVYHLRTWTGCVDGNGRRITMQEVA